MPRTKQKKYYGQHFLEPAWADKLIQAIEPQAVDEFLEIGPGPGVLTLRLAPQVKHLTAIEIDRDLVSALEGRLPGNVTLVHGDFLEIDAAAFDAQHSVRVVGNLPYNVSSPILFKLLRIHRDHGGLRDATLMLQREVAERIQAAPGSRQYGVLSIFVQLYADVRGLLLLPPGAFRPPPKVQSSVIAMRFRLPAVEIADYPTFEAMVRSMFTGRRKQLVNALRPFARDRGQAAAETLAHAGVDGTRRPETLQLSELAQLANAFSAATRKAVL